MYVPNFLGWVSFACFFETPVPSDGLAPFSSCLKAALLTDF